MVAVLRAPVLLAAAFLVGAFGRDVLVGHQSSRSPKLASLKRVCSSACRRSSTPTLSCPLILYHVPKTAGSSLRHVVHSAVAHHNLSAFIPCYGGIPCLIGGPTLESVLHCFEKQSVFAFSEAAMKVCMLAALQKDEWRHVLENFPEPATASVTDDPVPLAVSVARSLSCASVVVAHITPNLLRWASLMFHRLQGTGLARSLGLCSGPNVACASCWATVREPMSRTMSQIKHFHPSLISVRNPTQDAVIRVLQEFTKAREIAKYFGDNVQSAYVTPTVLEHCSVMVFETLQQDVVDLFAAEPWLGNNTLPVINDRPLPHNDKAVDVLRKLGLERWLRNDIALYHKVVQQKTSAVP